MKIIILKALSAFFLIYIVSYGLYNIFGTSEPHEIQQDQAQVDNASGDNDQADKFHVVESDINDLVESVEVEITPIPMVVPGDDLQQDQLADPQDEILVPQEYLTIQVYSFKTLDKAVRGYEKVKHFLQGPDRHKLRVEHVQSFYTVRAGKFSTTEPSGSQQAHLLLDKLQLKFNSAYLLSAYLIPERIQKIYQGETAPLPVLKKVSAIPAEISSPDMPENQAVAAPITIKDKETSQEKVPISGTDQKKNP